LGSVAFKTPAVDLTGEDLATKPPATQPAATPDRAFDDSEAMSSQVTWKDPPEEATPPNRYPTASANGQGGDPRQQEAESSAIIGLVTGLAAQVESMRVEMRHFRAVPADGVTTSRSVAAAAASAPTPVVAAAAGVPNHAVSPPAVAPSSSVPTRFRPSDRVPVGHTGISATHWYAVDKGRPNLDDTVYATEGEARLAVRGIADGNYEHFTDKAKREALAYLDRCRRMSELANSTPDSGLLPDVVPIQHPIYSPAQHDAIPLDVHEYPPELLRGADPSKGVDDHVYGVDIGSVHDLEANLSPPGMSEDDATTTRRR
jgi:hypothetical protein